VSPFGGYPAEPRCKSVALLFVSNAVLKCRFLRPLKFLAPTGLKFSTLGVGEQIRFPQGCFLIFLVTW
jgi:hypothetical protein